MKNTLTVVQRIPVLWIAWNNRKTAKTCNREYPQEHGSFLVFRPLDLVDIALKEYMYLVVGNDYFAPFPEKKYPTRGVEPRPTLYAA